MSIPREGSRDTGDGIIVSVTPDVCKTPVGSSMVPVPYSITAKQGDDANTVATVRMKGKRAHNMASLVTKCTGDAPGTGTGIKSGTVGSVCHPQTHSGTVRIGGEYAIRDADMWEMNNRNTIGRLSYVRSRETFEETPAILLTQNPLDEAPDSESGSDFVNAILGGIEGARADPLPEGSYQVAEAAPVIMNDAAPQLPRTNVPNSVGPTPATPTGPAANDNRPPNRVANPTPADIIRPNGAYRPAPNLGNMMSRSLGPAAIMQGAMDGLQPAMDEFITGGNSFNLTASRIATANGPHSFSSWHGNALSGDFSPELNAHIIERYEYYWNEIVPAGNAQLAEEFAYGSVREFRDMSRAEDAAAAQAQVTEENVRDTDDKEQRSDCIVGRYGSIRGTCGTGRQAHHIVPDYTLRYGPRPTNVANDNQRIPGMPSMLDGMAVCLSGNARVTGDEHHAAHVVTDALISASGAGPGPLWGTTTLGTVRQASNAGIIQALSNDPACAARAIAASEAQFAGLPNDRLLRSTMRPPRPGFAQYDAMVAGASTRNGAIVMP